MRDLVYILTRRLTEPSLIHVCAHKGTCWHIGGAMARGDTTALSLGLAREARIRACEDCRPWSRRAR